MTMARASSQPWGPRRSDGAAVIVLLVLMRNEPSA
jgi:hypothetical protein